MAATLTKAQLKAQLSRQELKMLKREQKKAERQTKHQQVGATRAGALMSGQLSCGRAPYDHSSSNAYFTLPTGRSNPGSHGKQ